VSESRAPRTAILSAVMRAAHLLLDGEPKTFSDPLALTLSGLNGEAELKIWLGRFVDSPRSLMTTGKGQPDRKKRGMGKRLSYISRGSR
jgi:hypothetical protein